MQTTDFFTVTALETAQRARTEALALLARIEAQRPLLEAIVAEAEAAATDAGVYADTALATVSASAPLAHSHEIGDLPTAPNGFASGTLLVRADDARLYDNRAPLPHTHADGSGGAEMFAPVQHSHNIGDLPVMPNGEASASGLVRADDSRLSDPRLPLAHLHPISEVEGLQTALDAPAPTPPNASETVAGIAELATQAEVDAGTADLRIVTSKKLSARRSTRPGTSTARTEAQRLVDHSNIDAREFGTLNHTNINAAMAYAANYTDPDGVLHKGGTVRLPASTITLAGPIDNQYNRVLLEGEGHGDGIHSVTGPLVYGTCFVPAFAGEVLIHRSPYGGPTTPRNTGGGFKHISAIGNGIGTRLLRVDSVTDGHYDLFLNDCVGTEAALFTSGRNGIDLGEDACIQRAFIKVLVRQLAAGAASACHGVVLRGSTTSNFSLNRDVMFDIQHKDGHGLILENADNNNIWVRTYAPSGTGKGVINRGGTYAGSPEYARENCFVYCSASGGIIFEGTDTPGVLVPASGFIANFDSQNGPADPIIGTGCLVVSRNGKGHELFPEQRRPIVGNNSFDILGARALRALRPSAGYINHGGSASHEILGSGYNAGTGVVAHEWRRYINTDGSYEIGKLTGGGGFVKSPLIAQSRYRSANAGALTLTGLISTYIVDATTGNQTLTLPLAALWGVNHTGTIRVRRVDASASVVTIQRAGTDTLNGGTAALTLAAGAEIELFADGTTAWLAQSVSETLITPTGATAARTLADQLDAPDTRHIYSRGRTLATPTAQQINFAGTASSLTNRWLDARLNVFGSVLDAAGFGDKAVNSINISDTADATGGYGMLEGLKVFHTAGGGSSAGARAALSSRMVITGTFAAHAPFVAALSMGYGAANIGGATGVVDASLTNFKGSLFGGNDNVWLAPGATNWFGVWGREIDVGILAGASARLKLGLLVAHGSNDAVRGVHDDAAVCVADLAEGSSKWKTGLALGATAAPWAFAADSTLIGIVPRQFPAAAPGTYVADKGVDFSAATFTTSAFASPGFSVDPDGDVVAKSLKLTNDDYNNLKSRGGVPTDSAVAGDLAATAAAITAAEALGPVYVPKGIYQTSQAPGALNGLFWGHGQIRDSQGNKRAPIFAAIKAQPAVVTNAGDGVVNGFNGTLDKVPIAIEHRITGVDTLGSDAQMAGQSYRYTPEASVALIKSYNSSGKNMATTTNGNRTAATVYSMHVANAGKGDHMAFNISGIATGINAGATSWLAGAAISWFGGDLILGAHGNYLNPVELNLKSSGFHGAAVGWVNNLYRDQDETDGLGNQDMGYWAAARYQSHGARGPNDGLSFTGLWRRILNTTRVTLPAATEPLLVAKANQRFYLNAVAASDPFHDPSLGLTWFAYSSSLTALSFVVQNGSVLQLYSNLCLSPQAIRSDTEFRVSTLRVVGARKTGWTPATGAATRTAFDTASVTLPQLAERVKALIDDLHATAGHGLIGT